MNLEVEAYEGELRELRKLKERLMRLENKTVDQYGWAYYSNNPDAYW